MNTRRCLQIADRMNALLLRELGQGVDGLRMVAEPLYARDVLLVCDAMPGTELAGLAQQFRAAATEEAPSAAAGHDAGAGPHPPARERTRGRSRERTGQEGDSGHRHGADTGATASSGFGASVWSRIASGFGLTNPGGTPSTDSQPGAGAGGTAAPPQRRWFSPARRRGGR